MPHRLAQLSHRIDLTTETNRIQVLQLECRIGHAVPVQDLYSSDTDQQSTGQLTERQSCLGQVRDRQTDRQTDRQADVG
jgi:hypothetical protein